MLLRDPHSPSKLVRMCSWGVVTEALLGGGVNEPVCIPSGERGKIIFTITQLGGMSQYATLGQTCLHPQQDTLGATNINTDLTKNIACFID